MLNFIILSYKIRVLKLVSGFFIYEQKQTKMYSQKIVQDLKPDWYLKMSKSEKSERQEWLKKEHAKMWSEKPKPISSGAILVAKSTRKSITEGKEYKITGYFAILISTIYCPQWNEFVIIKNDNGWTVKMNLNNFLTK